ncbi:MAG: hypothetical protein FJ379_10990 [Verrucomicrobia bacterium]|nr:hypothetical protein [Verrucomicrobiota bacterium]
MGGKPGDRVSGWNVLVLNLATTPGLGSFLAGRRWAGSLQMLVAVSGFGVLILWFWDLARQFWDLLQSGDTVVRSDFRQLGIGGALFGGAWLWSLWTSISILRQARRDRSAVPPPLTPQGPSTSPGD